MKTRHSVILAMSLSLIAGSCGDGETTATSSTQPTTTTASVATTTEMSTTTLPVPSVTNGILLFERTDFLGIGPSGLMGVSPDGGDVRVLASEENAFYTAPSWSSDGSLVAVSKWGPATGGLGPMPGQDIWVMDADGGSLANLTNSPEWSGYDPVWSPDGSRIAFTLAPGESSDLSAEIWTVSADGTDLIPLTASADRDEVAPSWSPDGSKIAFTSGPLEAGPFGSDRIEVVSEDGSDRTVLAEVPVMDLGWSPDGSRIVFSQMMGRIQPEYGEADEVPTFDIWIMDVNGNNLINVTNTPELDERHPRWAPDGLRIAYESQGDIWLMDAAGNGKVNLTATDGPREGGPEWSPDGSQIAYTRDDDPQRESSDWGQTAVWVMLADGSNHIQLTSGDFWDHNLAWQPLRLDT